MTDDDDERLLAALRRLTATVDAVPLSSVTAARAAFGWRTLGAEVAAVAYDSALATPSPVGVRGVATQGRFLSFEAPGVTVEMEAISSGPRRRVRGELAPPQPGPVEARQPGRSTTVVADEMGRFLVDDLRAGPLSLRLPGRRALAGAVITDWVLL
jgi:hypothetical protein